MTKNCSWLSLLCIFTFNTALPQACPRWGDNAAALKFLQENKPNSTAADPACVNRAFSTLSESKTNMEALIGLLDFERSIEKDHSLKGVPSKYPAVGALTTIGKPAIPLLIKTIKENESELIRTNATHALDGMYRSCEKDLIDKLEAEAAKSEIPPDQQQRLRTAAKYVQDRHAVVACKPSSPTSM